MSKPALKILSDPALPASEPGRLRAVLHEQRGERVYTAILDAILERRLQPGVRLSEEALAEAFNVSRTLVRQALIRLTAEGIAVAERHRGCQVATLSPEEAEDVFAARRMVELEIVRLAARRASRADCDELLASIAEEKNAAARGDHGTEIRLSGEFHLLIALVAGNKPLAQFLRTLVPQTAMVISLYERGSVPSCSIGDHTALVSAIADGNSKLAERLMAQHLDHIRARLSFSGASTASDLISLFSRDAARDSAGGATTSKKESSATS
jgi:DNA-binding GntR family transcriptional regulator